MTDQCGQCPRTLPLPPAAVPAGAAPEPADAQWGLAPVGLGLLALIPTALLVSSLALVLPLPTATVLSAGALGIVQVGLVWLLAMRVWPPPFRLVGLKRSRQSLPRTFGAVLIAIAASLGFAQLYTLAAMALGWDFLTPRNLPDDLLLPGAMSLISVIALAVWTPFAEELFFRGFVMRGLVHRWGSGPGLFLSAAIFAALHFSPALLLPVFVTGLLLGGLYRYTDSLWPPVAVHAAQNALAALTIIYGL